MRTRGQKSIAYDRWNGVRREATNSTVPGATAFASAPREWQSDSDDSAPGTLLRRADFVDEVFAAGKWQPTKAIVDYMFGHNNNIDTISEAEARRLKPAAFSSPR